MKKTLRIIEISLLCVVWLGLSVFSWLKPAQDISTSERRPLKQFPQITAAQLESGKFMTNFESYTLDQFPFRDGFRRLKALSAYGIFQQLDNNDIYIVDGQASKLDFPVNQSSMDHASAAIVNLYNTYLKDTGANFYFSIVPDKGYYLAEANGYPAMDYEMLTQYMRDQLSFAQYIDIFPTLGAEDYYATDSHWKQENLEETVQAIAQGMGLDLSFDYEKVTVEQPFYGVYYGQAALPLQPDTLTYLRNEILDNCLVHNLENGTVSGIYNMDKVLSQDPYEMFLSGATPMLVLENPNAATGRNLIVFRDSFGSSLLPLLAEAYETITILDTRYIQPDYLGQYVDFSAADDVLFLYCTTLLNSSGTLK